MAKKRRVRRKGARRSPRRNPSPAPARRKGRGRAIARRVLGLDYRAALKNIPLNVVGMFAAKWLAKRGEPAAAEFDPESWSGMSYLKGAVGASAAAFAANAVKPGSGQRVLEGGLALMLYKIIQIELIPKSETASNWFGQDETPGYQPGDVETNEANEPYILGENGQWIPLDESARALPEYGDVLETPGRLGYGDVLETPGRLGFGQQTIDAYRKSLFQR